MLKQCDYLTNYTTSIVQIYLFQYSVVRFFKIVWLNYYSLVFLKAQYIINLGLYIIFNASYLGLLCCLGLEGSRFDLKLLPFLLINSPRSVSDRAFIPSVDSEQTTKLQNKTKRLATCKYRTFGNILMFIYLSLI